MEDLIDSGSGNSSTSGDSLFINTPFAPLSEVISDKDLLNIFSGLGNGEGSGSPLGGSGNNGIDFSSGVDPFADENFWNIFAGGVNPTVVGSISTTEIPDNIQIPSFGTGGIPSFGTGGIPSFGTGGIPSFGTGGIPSFGTGGIPSFGTGGIPSFGTGGIPSFGTGGIPSFGTGGIPSFGTGGIPSFGTGEIPFA
ncbi:hypothetical protein [Nostoc sp. WHI]|uniref:hypothetical protein n=1 Tax=Nostoc sp. WHI TaxID=2650611 RepID=UPI0018C5A39C|nr:hypothetical protein [Nostoc sp. WHI]MBG1269333.1 hypothetical protein [Nostoc sp. WHI]